jgi:hypothetical protein
VHAKTPGRARRGFQQEAFGMPITESLAIVTSVDGVAFGGPSVCGGVKLSHVLLFMRHLRSARFAATSGGS